MAHDSFNEHPLIVELFGRLAHVAPKMNSLVKSPDAVVHYDLLAGALWWSDERPDFDEATDHSCLRPVFRYRTTLILGQPEEQYESWWERANRLFPNWPGFAAERCSPDATLAKLYRMKNQAELLSVTLADIACRLQKAFKSNIPWKAIQQRAYRREWADITVGEVHELVCRYLRRSGRRVPGDSLDRIRHVVASSTGVDREQIAADTWLARL